MAAPSPCTTPVASRRQQQPPKSLPRALFGASPGIAPSPGASARFLSPRYSGCQPGRRTPCSGPVMATTPLTPAEAAQAATVRSSHRPTTRPDWQSPAASGSKKKQGNTPPVTPPAWVPDDSVRECMGCDAAFGFFRRRHHCRACGKVFCDNCSRYRSPIPLYGIKDRVRVCQICINSFANVGSPAQSAQATKRQLVLRHAPDSPLVAALSPSARRSANGGDDAAINSASRPLQAQQDWKATHGAAFTGAGGGAGAGTTPSRSSVAAPPAATPGTPNVFADPSVKSQLRYGRQLFASPIARAQKLAIRTLDPLTSPLWVPDQLVSECAHCSTEFSLFNRKHHCRACGNVFCKKCSQVVQLEETVNGETSTRVCCVCFESHRVAAPVASDVSVSIVANDAPPSASAPSDAVSWASLPSNTVTLIASFTQPRDALSLRAVSRGTRAMLTSHAADVVVWRPAVEALACDKCSESQHAVQSVMALGGDTVGSRSCPGRVLRHYLTLMATPASFEEAVEVLAGGASGGDTLGSGGLNVTPRMAMSVWATMHLVHSVSDTRGARAKALLCGSNPAFSVLQALLRQSTTPGTGSTDAASALSTASATRGGGLAKVGPLSMPSCMVLATTGAAGAVMNLALLSEGTEDGGKRSLMPTWMAGLLLDAIRCDLASGFGVGADGNKDIDDTHLDHYRKRIQYCSGALWNLTNTDVESRNLIGMCGGVATMLDVVVATQAQSQGLSMWAQRVSLYALGTLSNVWSNHAESRTAIAGDGGSTTRLAAVLRLVRGLLKSMAAAAAASTAPTATSAGVTGTAAGGDTKPASKHGNATPSSTPTRGRAAMRKLASPRKPPMPLASPSQAGGGTASNSNVMLSPMLSPKRQRHCQRQLLRGSGSSSAQPHTARSATTAAVSKTQRRLLRVACQALREALRGGEPVAVAIQQQRLGMETLVAATVHAVKGQPQDKRLADTSSTCLLECSFQNAACRLPLLTKHGLSLVELIVPAVVPTSSSAPPAMAHLHRAAGTLSGVIMNCCTEGFGDRALAQQSTTQLLSAMAQPVAAYMASLTRGAIDATAMPSSLPRVAERFLTGIHSLVTTGTPAEQQQNAALCVKAGLHRVVTPAAATTVAEATTAQAAAPTLGACVSAIAEALELAAAKVPVPVPAATNAGENVATGVAKGRVVASSKASPRTKGKKAKAKTPRGSHGRKVPRSPLRHCVTYNDDE